MPSLTDRQRGWARTIAGGALTVVGGVLLVALSVALSGGDPVEGLRALYRGSIGSADSLATSIKFATPLMFTGLSVALAFQCKLWNIGSEGQFLAGMLAAAAVALVLPGLSAWLLLPLCVLVGILVGALWAVVPLSLKLGRDVPEVITTIMMNFLAVFLLAYMVRGPLREPGSDDPQSAQLPLAAWLRDLADLATIEKLPGGLLRGPSGAIWVNGWLSLEVLHAGIILALIVIAGV